ncbi:SUKH-4 family immunity protein [Streptomyces malaysiensis]|uniref:SUKH-4 family immunity protein n=1 Tax=Streptomyces malaysiensis TaxID=92644 RepID=UPI0036B2FD58
MVTYAQAQERAELWINGDVPAYQQREARVREFDLGFVVWAEDRADGPVSGRSAEGVRLVIARDSGETTLWPGLPVGEVIRRYEERYGTTDGSRDESTSGRQQRIDLNATSFLLTPPEWLQEAADAMSSRSEGRLDLPEQRPGAEPGGGAPDAAAAAAASAASAPVSGPPASATPSAAPPPSPPAPAQDGWPAAGGSGQRAQSMDDWPADGGVQGAPPAPPAPVSGAPAPGAPAPGAPAPGAPAPGAPAPGAPVPGPSQGRGGAVDDWPSDGVARPLAADRQQDAPPAPGAPSGGEGWRNAPPTGGPSPWAPPAPGSGTPSSGSQAGNAATPGGGTPWAGTDITGDDDDDRSVAPPATVFAPPLAGSDDEDTPPPGVRPDAKTELMSGGSSLPPTAIAPGLDFPPPQGGPAAGPGAGANASDLADAATHKAGGGATPPPPGAPGTPGARPGADSTPPTPPPAPSGPGAPGAPAGGYVPTQLVSQLGPDGPDGLGGPGGPGGPGGAPQPPGPPGAPGVPGGGQTPPPGAPGGPGGGVHAAATMLAGGPGAPGGQTPPPGAPQPPGPPGVPGAGGPHTPPPPPGAAGPPYPGGPGAPGAPGMAPPAGAPVPGMAPPPGAAAPGMAPPPGYAYPPPPPGQPTVGPGYMAVLRYRAQDGSEQQLIRRSAPGTPHPEWQILHELRAMNVPPQQVLELHTELESCDLPGGYCARMIRESWPQVRISHTAAYGRDHATRQQGVRHLLEHQGELHQVADGPARPAPNRVPLPHPSQVQPIPPVPPEGLAHELGQAFGPQGIVRFDQRAVSRTGVPDVVAQTLVWAGLPLDFGPFFWAQAQAGRPVPTLAELAAERGVQSAPDAGSYLVMGNDFGRQLCVQYGTANIVAVPLEATPQPTPPQFVNTGLPEFVRCMALLGRMWRLRYGLTPDQAGRWTVDFQAQLAGLDPAALSTPDNWWAVLLEQMWDGLL